MEGYNRTPKDFKINSRGLSNFEYARSRSIRYFIKKGTDINSIDKNISIEINDKINNKKRKILGYLPAEKLFLDELAKIGVTQNTIFYKN